MGFRIYWVRGVEDLGLGCMVRGLWLRIEVVGCRGVGV